MSLERYEPSGQGRDFIGPGAVVRIVAAEGIESEENVMKRIFTGICATWGLEDYNPEEQPPDLIKATIILGLNGDFWVGQQFEAWNITLKFINVSRGFTHQLVRARFMAFGQEGTRDTNQLDFDVLIPQTIHDDHELCDEFRAIVERSREFIKKANERDIPFQDSSYITPKGLMTDITGHMNFRALQEFMSARLSNTMHWEINHVARLMLKEVRDYYPTFGLWLAPRCELVGKCQSSATLFPPCGKLPLRENQSAVTNRFGIPYGHQTTMNPGADATKVLNEYEAYLQDREQRAGLVSWAREIFEKGDHNEAQRQLFKA